VIRVLHLRQSAALYGADRAVLALSAATPAPYAPLVGAIVRPDAPDALVDEARKLGVTGLRFESRRRFDLACARAVAKVARDHQVRLLHAHDFKALFVALVAGRMARIPVVATFHGDTRATMAVRMYEGVARFLANFTRGATAVSRSLVKKLRRWVHAAPVDFVPNAIALPASIGEQEREEARRRFGVTPDAFCIAIVGRLAIEKGHRVLFEAVKHLRATLLIAGDGPLRTELEQAAAGLEARFLGYLREGSRAVIAAADVVALPSLTEGLPLVALETLALGRPLVASAVGELPELLGGGAGVLVPAGDPAALERALTALQQAPNRTAIAQRAVERARDYDVAAMAEAYASLYERALSPPSTSR
jgi:glycosyltransferase involved in cell wall biosynthesis